MGYGRAVLVCRKVKRERSFASNSKRLIAMFDTHQDIMEPWPAVLGGKATRPGSVKTITTG
jgi:hypothetical protein